MQPLAETTKLGDAKSSARHVLDVVPPVMWFIRRHMRRHRKGLSVPQFRALAKINSHPRACLSEVAEHLGASKSTTSRIVALLVDKELLARAYCHDDRRQMALVITPRGRAMLDAARAATQQRMQDELARLSPGEHATLEAAMQILSGVFGTLDNPAPLATPLPPAPAHHGKLVTR